MDRERREEIKTWATEQAQVSVLELLADLEAAEELLEAYSATRYPTLAEQVQNAEQRAEAAEGRAKEAEEGYTDFVNEILERAPSSWDGDEPAQQIAVDYVRDLEQRAALAEQTIVKLREGLAEIQKFTPAQNLNFRRCYKLLEETR